MEGEAKMTEQEEFEFRHRLEKERLVSASAGKPSPAGSFGQNVAAGMGKFVSDTARGGKQLIDDAAAGIEGMAPNAFGAANKFLGMDSAKNIQAKGRAAIEDTRKLDLPLMDTGAGMLGYALGGLSTAPLMPMTSTVGGAAAAGGAMGLMQPATSWSERGTNVATGAAVGGAGQAGMNALGRIVKPNTAPEILALLKEGVTPTPGQILGGSYRRAEDAMTSVPLLGDAIKGGQRRAIEDVNKAAFNRALSPLGEKLPKNTLGREAVDFTYEKLGDAYKNLLPKMTTQADNQFATEIGNLKKMVSQGAIDPNSALAFERILQNKVLGKFQGQSSISGETMKGIESTLGNEIKRFAQSQDADQRLIGDALKEVQATLRGLVTRSNPNNSAELQAINEGYANFKRIQRASGSLGSQDGIFTPAQLQNAVKALDRSKDKARFSEGRALMQDLSDPAKSSLASTVPDSGTAYRSLLGLLGVGAGHAVVGPAAPVAAGLGMAAYSQPGQSALAALLAKRPDSASRLAELIRASGPYIGQGGAALAVQQKPF